MDDCLKETNELHDKTDEYVSLVTKVARVEVKSALGQEI